MTIKVKRSQSKGPAKPTGSSLAKGKTNQGTDGTGSGNEISGSDAGSDSKNGFSKSSAGPDSRIEFSVRPSNLDSYEPDFELTPDDFQSDAWIGKIYDDPRRLPLSVKEECFHAHNAKGYPTGVVDNRIFQYITHTQHIFVCGKVPYVYKDGVYHIDLDGTIIKSMIKACCLEQYIRSTTIERVYKLFLQDNGLVMHPEELNAHEPRYINFQNGMYDAVRKKIYPHGPKAYSINQLPMEYDPDGDHGSGTEIEKFLNYAIPDQEDREMLLEYIGLCCTIDTSQQKMLVICGDGGTGKSTVINLIQQMVGKRNVSNVSMSKLSKDFHSISMMGKLLNSCADLEIDALDDVTKIKQLIGEDSIHDSFKGKDLISFDNYAKMLFSTNELPLVRNEKTDGFYRRLLVLTMNEKPKMRDATLPKRLQAELPYLLHLAMEALNRMYKRGYILESKNSKEKALQLRRDSDTIEAFLSDKMVVTGDSANKINRADLYKAYKEFCEEWERQGHTKSNFFKALRNKGFLEARMAGGICFCGIKERVGDEDFMQIPEDDGTTPF